MTVFIIILVIVFFLIAIVATADKNEPKKEIESPPEKEKATIEYDNSETNEPHYLFYSIKSEYFNDLDRVTKENAAAFPDIYQIAYTLFDKQRKLIAHEYINIEFDYLPPGLKRRMAETEEELKEEPVPVVEALQEFSDKCKTANLFITHAEFHHKNILFANYLKHGLDLPFKDSQSVDLMEKAKGWVSVYRDSGRGLKLPSYVELLGKAVQDDPYAIRKKEFSAVDKAFCLPYIYFAWKDKQ